MPAHHAGIHLVMGIRLGSQLLSKFRMRCSNREE